MKYKVYRGCGNCKFDGNCRDFKKKVKATFTKGQYADCWGRRVRVFNPGEPITAEAVIKENTVYCMVAKSPIYKEYDDFVDLNHVIIEVMENGKA